MSIESAQNNNASNPERWIMTTTIKSSNDQRSDVEILAERIEKLEKTQEPFWNELEQKIIKVESANRIWVAQPELVERVDKLESENKLLDEQLNVWHDALQVDGDKFFGHANYRELMAEIGQIKERFKPIENHVSTECNYYKNQLREFRESLTQERDRKLNDIGRVELLEHQVKYLQGEHKRMSENELPVAKFLDETHSKIEKLETLFSNFTLETENKILDLGAKFSEPEFDEVKPAETTFTREQRVLDKLTAFVHWCAAASPGTVPAENELRHLMGRARELLKEIEG